MIRYAMGFREGLSPLVGVVLNPRWNRRDESNGSSIGGLDWAGVFAFIAGSTQDDRVRSSSHVWFSSVLL